SNKVNLGITVNSCTGIDESENEVFTVYPNPGQGIYNLVTSNSLPYRIQVLDITGRMLIDQELHTSNYTLNIQNYTNGIYYLKIISGNSTKSIRLIKE
ncbi:MAG: T9SS type A sorting domain-containing protein, partial [Bacteroidia bacterium]